MRACVRACTYVVPFDKLVSGDQRLGHLNRLEFDDVDAWSSAGHRRHSVSAHLSQRCYIAPVVSRDAAAVVFRIMPRYDATAITYDDSVSAISVLQRFTSS